MNAKRSAILSIRLTTDTRDQLADLADAMGRTKSFLAVEAIKHYIALNAWQVDAISSTLKKAERANSKFVEHDEVAEWLNSWGTENEKDKPSCK